MTQRAHCPIQPEEAECDLDGRPYQWTIAMAGQPDHSVAAQPPKPTSTPANTPPLNAVLEFVGRLFKAG